MLRSPSILLRSFLVMKILIFMQDQERPSQTSTTLDFLRSLRSPSPLLDDYTTSAVISNTVELETEEIDVS